MTRATDMIEDLADIASAELKRAGASTRQGALQGAVGLVVAGIAGLGLLLIAVGTFLHLMTVHGPLLAGLWVGGALFCLGAVVAGVGFSVAGRRAKARAEARARIARSVAQADLEALIGSMAGDRKTGLGLAAAALAAGFFAGRR